MHTVIYIYRVILLILLASFTCVTALFLGFLVLRNDPYAFINRLFFLMTVATAVWALGAMVSYATPNFQVMKFVFRLKVISAGIYSTILLHFVLSISIWKDLVQFRRAYLLYFPITIISIIVIISNGGYFTEFQRVGNNWHYNHQYNTPIFVFTVIYWGVSMLAALCILFYCSKKAEGDKIKRQFYILAWSLGFTIIVTIIKIIGFPFLFNIPSSGGTVALQLIWLFSIVYLVDRYRFLLPEQYAQREALMELNGYAILILDRFFQIKIMNREAKDLLGTTHKKLLSTPQIENYFHPSEPFISNLQDLQAEKTQKSFACSIEILSKSWGKIPADVKASALRDELSGNCCFLITFYVNEKRKKIQFRFGLSTREIEVLQFLINGYSNQEIADKLFIAERTVKTHISHIFQKLGVDNRVKVILLLKEYGLLSEQQAEKEVLLL